MISRRQIGLMVAISILVGCATAKLPGTSGANYVLQQDALQFVMILEAAGDKTCKQSKVVNTEIAEQPNNPGKDPWTEKWTVDRCGKLVYYRVKFTPSPRGGTDFSVGVWN